MSIIQGHAAARLAALIATLALTGPACAGDVARARDHAGLRRVEGAEIRAYRQPALEQVSVPLGPIAGDAAAAPVRRLEGEVSHIDYRIAPPVSATAIATHYATVLRKAGYSAVFACQGLRACGSGMGALILHSDMVAPAGFADGVLNGRLQVIVARRGDDWVLLHMVEGPDRSLVYEAVIRKARTTG